MKSILREVIGHLSSNLDESKELLKEAIEKSNIRERGIKKEMISTINSISDSRKLLFYAYNSLLKYEGDGVYQIKV